MRGRAFRRHQAVRHQKRRLSEDRNQHYNNLDCPCWTDPKVMAQFKRTPCRCSCNLCGHKRRIYGLTIQERRQEWIE